MGALCAILLLISRISVGADNPFVRSAEIEPDVKFWIRVYTEVTTNGGFVHDDRKLGVVYEVMRFPDNLSRKERLHQVEQAKGKYRAILRRLARLCPLPPANGHPGKGVSNRLCLLAAPL